jgi:hypothetical protein
MTADSKALPEFERGPGGSAVLYCYDATAYEWQATEDDLVAVLAALPAEQRARVLEPYLTDSAREALDGYQAVHGVLEDQRARADAAEQALAAERAKVAAYESFWREHGEIITHCPGHHNQLVRDADRLLGHSPQPTEVTEELDRVKAARDSLRATLSNVVDRITTIADEACELQPVMPVEDVMTLIEAKLHDLRATLAKVEAERDGLHEFLREHGDYLLGAASYTATGIEAEMPGHARARDALSSILASLPKGTKET